jgi:hypothetical protein
MPAEMAIDEQRYELWDALASKSRMRTSGIAARQDWSQNHSYRIRTLHNYVVVERCPNCGLPYFGKRSDQTTGAQ